MMMMLVVPLSVIMVRIGKMMITIVMMAVMIMIVLQR